MSDKEKTTGLALQVIAGGLAAVTAALLGSTLGLAGTVAGAGLASVVSTVAAALYLRSIERTRSQVRQVHARVTGRAGSERMEDGAAEPAPRRGVRPSGWPLALAGGVLAFVLGLLVITGVEWVSGERVSGGAGTTIGGIVSPRQHQAPAQRPGDDDPPAPPAVTGPTASVPSTEPAPTTTPSAGNGTTSPPVTSTTTVEPTTPPPSSAPISGQLPGVN